MTDNFIAFFYRERLLVAVVSMLIVAGGVLALSKLNVDAFPDVTPVQVEIDTEAEGLAPQEVEQLITFPIENVMNGIPGVVRVQSISKFGLSVVNVYFRDDVDIYFARQQVFERLSLRKGRHAGWVRAWYGAHHDRHRSDLSLPNRRSRTRAIRNCVPFRTGSSNCNLRTVPGVADVLSFGGDVKQYHVIVDQQALVNYNIPLKVTLRSHSGEQSKHRGQLHRARRRSICRSRTRASQGRRRHQEHRARLSRRHSRFALATLRRFKSETRFVRAPSPKMDRAKWSPASF